MLQEDFTISANLKVIEELFKDHEDISSYEDSCTDTFDRDNIIEHLCQKLSLPSFPINGTSELAKEDFKTRFKSKAKDYNIEVNWN